MIEFTLLDFDGNTKNEKQNQRLTNLNTNQLPELSPSDASVNNILNYSKALSVRKSKHTGFIDQILN